MLRWPRGTQKDNHRRHVSAPSGHWSPRNRKSCCDRYLETSHGLSRGALGQDKIGFLCRPCGVLFRRLILGETETTSSKTSWLAVVAESEVSLRHENLTKVVQFWTSTSCEVRSMRLSFTMALQVTKKDHPSPLELNRDAPGVGINLPTQFPQCLDILKTYSPQLAIFILEPCLLFKVRIALFDSHLLGVDLEDTFKEIVGTLSIVISFLLQSCLTWYNLRRMK